MCNPLKIVHNKCVHIRNHAIKVLYGQCNRKIWYLVDVLAVFAATIIQNNVM